MRERRFAENEVEPTWVDQAAKQPQRIVKMFVKENIYCGIV